MKSDQAVELTNVYKSYHRGARSVVAVDNLSLTVPSGEFLTLMGPSGSGKSTVLNLIAGLDVADSGEIRVAGGSLAGMTDEQLTDMRRTRIGFVFQFFNLLPSISALENVRLPLDAGGVSRGESAKRAEAALDLAGLVDRADHLPEQLSGGELQRVAVARALVIDPVTILADEPTGNLDSVAGDEILRILRRCNKERGVTVILVTHSAVAAAYGDRVITLRDGRVEDDILNRPTKEAPAIRPV